MPKQKAISRAAVMMGRAGNKARMLKVSPERRREIATTAALARWSRRVRSIKPGA